MDDIFGKITAGTILLLIPIVIQIAKEHFAWDDKKARISALILSAVFTIPWYVLENVEALFEIPDIEAVVALLRLIFESVLYTLLVWLTVTGAYHLGVKPARERMLKDYPQ